MARFFNTAGPNREDWHYTVPTLARLPELQRLVEARQWFVLHAPRQSGKTTAMRALATDLTASGDYAALWATCEMGEPVRDAPAEASQLVVNDIDRNASLWLPKARRPPPPSSIPAGADHLANYLKVWCETCPRPVVLLLDEIDALHEAALTSVLRQLRGLYPNRPHGAPAALALIGLRDVRSDKPVPETTARSSTASPFNVKVKALTLHNLSRQDVVDLYAQHSRESGQPFTPEAVALAYELTQGQPWLVTALAHEICTEMGVAGPIDTRHVLWAKERLLAGSSTHLDNLADKLHDPRVQGVVAPLLAGEELPLAVSQNDIAYCAQIGLVARDVQPVRIANPIYRELVPRALTLPSRLRMVLPDRIWSLGDGRLDLTGVLEAFVAFWREHGAWFVRGQTWAASAHQLVWMAFWQRVVEGRGCLEPDYGLGRQRLELLVRWFVGADASGVPTGEERHASLVKVWRDEQPSPLTVGLQQMDGMLDRYGLATGTLMLFDARDAPLSESSWALRGESAQTPTPAGRTVTVLQV